MGRGLDGQGEVAVREGAAKVIIKSAEIASPLERLATDADSPEIVNTNSGRKDGSYYAVSQISQYTLH